MQFMIGQHSQNIVLKKHNKKEKPKEIYLSMTSRSTYRHFDMSTCLFMGRPSGVRKLQPHTSKMSCYYFTLYLRYRAISNTKTKHIIMVPK